MHYYGVFPVIALVPDRLKVSARSLHIRSYAAAKHGDGAGHASCRLRSGLDGFSSSAVRSVTTMSLSYVAKRMLEQPQGNLSSVTIRSLFLKTWFPNLCPRGDHRKSSNCISGGEQTRDVDMLGFYNHSSDLVRLSRRAFRFVSSSLPRSLFPTPARPACSRVV